MTFANQKGTVLTFIVIGIGLIVALSAGALYLTSTASLSGLSANDQNQAYHLAKAGIEYALTNNLSKASTFTLKEGKFSLTFSVDKIESTGIVKEGTPYEVKRKIVVKQTGFGSRPDVSFAKDISEFAKTIKTTTPNPEDLIGVTSSGQVVMGKDKSYAFGGISYGGTVSNICTDGICNFGDGFMAYFKFKITNYSGSTPHGFVFTFFNGKNNISTAMGGELGTGTANDMPELLGYAGDSCRSRSTPNARCDSFLDGTGTVHGIVPPKVAIEFDAWQQTCTTPPCPTPCSSSSPCFPISRCDGIDNSNHMAYVFWGDNTRTCRYENSVNYDDNQHGAWTTGSTTQPKNSDGGNIDPNYPDYFTGPSWTPHSSWLYNGSTYAVRIEVKRSTITGDQGSYEIKTWLEKCSGDISDPNCCSEITNFDNVKKTYTTTSLLDLPQMNRTIVLSKEYHADFSNFSLGWRFAAGGASMETVTLSNFVLYFIK